MSLEVGQEAKDLSYCSSALLFGHKDLGPAVKIFCHFLPPHDTASSLCLGTNAQKILRNLFCVSFRLES